MIREINVSQEEGKVARLFFGFVLILVLMERKVEYGWVSALRRNL